MFLTWGGGLVKFAERNWPNESIDESIISHRTESYDALWTGCGADTGSSRCNLSMRLPEAPALENVDGVIVDAAMLRQGQG